MLIFKKNLHFKQYLPCLFYKQGINQSCSPQASAYGYYGSYLAFAPNFMPDGTKLGADIKLSARIFKLSFKKIWCFKKHFVNLQNVKMI